jgi:hypothetical protein
MDDAARNTEIPEMKVYAESLSVDISRNTQPKIKKNPIAAVRYVIGGELNKIKLMNLMTIRMAQITNDTRDIISVAFLDIGCLTDSVSYQFFGNIH